MTHVAITDQQLEGYREAGYILIRELFDTEEIELLHRAA